MPTVGATPLEVAYDYRARIERLPVHSAFVLYDPTRNTIVLTTFFDEVDHEAEQELAKVDGYMLDSFSEFALDFRTIHLLGRDVTNFIPGGAFPLIQPRKTGPHRAAN
jgi:hypothetical protein